MSKHVDFGGGVNLGKAPCLETALEGIEIRSGFEELGQDDTDKLIFVSDAERSAGGEPFHGV